MAAIGAIRPIKDSMESFGAHCSGLVSLTHCWERALSELGPQRVPVRAITQFGKVLVAMLFAIVGHICKSVFAVEWTEDVFHRL